MPSSRTAWARRGFAAVAMVGTLALIGCSSTADDPQADTAAPPPPAAAPSATPQGDDAPVGPACATLPDSGPGSPAAIADQPVATAAAQNPDLSTLVTAVTEAGLVDTLNEAENITVFAPTNDAFAKIPEETLAEVLADREALTEILTYHVVGERNSPSDLDTGSLETLQGGTISTTRTGDTYTANDAEVLCGNVQTSNATVYLIDTVLMPPS
jgi:uncharacterized surface protein with fasciclin (FAS1) repeats